MKSLNKILVSIAFIFLNFKGFSQDSITIAVEPAYDSVSGFHRFLFGENYRKEWATPVKMRIVHLSKEKGGLKITEKGGGNQTKSLRLADPNGKEWVIRSIQKYPERGLPPNLRKSIAKDILQDQVVTSHPFAALAVPPLSKVLELEHHNPEVVYIADDEALGEFRNEFANSVMLLEERQPLHFEKTQNTEKVQEKFEEDNDRSVDQKKLLRARLLDLVIGDWDRHEDQWRWALDENGVYEPIAKDRDKVFYTTSGIFPGLLSKQGNKANLQGFLPSIKRINQYNFNNRYFDRYFLNELSEQDWLEEISYVQTKLTDEELDQAVKKFPENIYALSGKKITEILINRRNNLKENALTYYYALSRNVDIPGSVKSENFHVNYAEDGTVTIEVMDKNAQTIFKRSFHPSYTKEIRLYSLGGEDHFSIGGAPKNNIKLFLVGGKGNDQFTIGEEVNNRRRISIYDNENEENILPEESKFRNRLSTDINVHEFDKKNFVYDKSGPFINALFNLDLGFIMGAGIVEQKHGFRKEPFANRQVLSANYSFTRKAFLFSYDAEFKELLGKNNLIIQFLSRGPQYVSNFFGLGNESDFPNENGKNLEYYRNRYDVISASAGLSRNLSKYLTVQSFLGLQYYTSDQSNNNGKFLSEYNSKNPDEDVFSDKIFSGLSVGVNFNSTNASLLPDNGILWRTNLLGMVQMDGNKERFSKLESNMVFYIELSKREQFVVANRLGAGISQGNPSFFQQFQLGGPNNLRGYAINRFTGSSMFYHNIEARIKLFDFNSYLFPGTFGLTGFHDIGRVWMSNESSKTWHRGYGAGLFLLPADVVVIQFLMGWSKEGHQPYVSLGMSF